MNLPVPRSNRLLPSKEEVSKWLQYDPGTGALFRIACLHPASKATGKCHACNLPKQVGKKNKYGYLVYTLLGMTNLQVSRIAWLLHTGKDPGERQVDHVNGNKEDNAWANLRLANKNENMANRSKQRTMGGSAPSSKYKGVCVFTSKNKYRYIRATITLQGKSRSLGSFPTEEAAHAAYCEAAKKYHGEFAKVD